MSGLAWARATSGAYIVSDEFNREYRLWLIREHRRRVKRVRGRKLARIMERAERREVGA